MIMILIKRSVNSPFYCALEIILLAHHQKLMTETTVSCKNYRYLQLAQGQADKPRQNILAE